MNQEVIDSKGEMLEIARNAIDARAQLDGYSADEYDTQHDPEGFITSLINALHQWSHVHHIDWEVELARAQGFFEQDMATFEQAEMAFEDKPDLSEMRCPKCGAREAFVIEVTSNLLMFPDGVTLQDDAGEEWGDWSYCRCYACDHRGTVYQFRVAKQQPEDTCDG